MYQIEINKDYIKKYYKQYPIFFKISFFDINFVKSFNDDNFLNLIFKTHINIKINNKDYLFIRVEFLLDEKEDNNLYSKILYNTKFIPLNKNYYEQILTILTNLKIDKQNIDYSKLKTIYDKYFVSLEEISNSPFILNNIETILNNQIDNIINITNKNHFGEFLSPIVTFKQIEDFIGIKEENFKKNQKKLIESKLDKKNGIIQQLYLSALNFLT